MFSLIARAGKVVGVAVAATGLALLAAPAQATPVSATSAAQPDTTMTTTLMGREFGPDGTVRGDCGSVTFGIRGAGRPGQALFTVHAESTRGPIITIFWAGVWARPWPLPPSAGGFNSGQFQLSGLFTRGVGGVAVIRTGSGRVFGNLTVLVARTTDATCVGLLPSAVGDVG